MLSLSHATRAWRRTKSIFTPAAQGARWFHNNDLPITFGDISKAMFRIRGGVPRTPVFESRRLSKILGCDVVLKAEHQLPTGSFKERGARNALLALSPDQKKRGVIAASAGNHAQALAYHGAELGIPVTVIMPIIAPLTKIQNCKDMGATVYVEGAHIGESKEIANRLVEKEGLQYINGYDDPEIIAGAGTLGMEIIDQVPDVDVILVPVGGAGLIAGVSMAVKALNPNVQIIGIEPKLVPSLQAAIAAGAPTYAMESATLADGLAVPVVGSNAFAIAKEYVDRLVTVREKYIALAMLRLVELEKCVIEGGGAAGIAALLEDVVPECKGRRVVVPLCGGNVDTPVLGRVIERGLAADGRLIKFKVAVSDRPGGIAALTQVLAEVGASIKDIYHERAWIESSLSQVLVKCVVETSSFGHAEEMFTELAKRGYDVAR